MSMLTNRRTRQRFRVRPFAYDINQPECKCRGECIGNTDTPCPFRGYKNRSGYCKTCYEAMKEKTGYDDSFYPGKSEKEIGQAECETIDVNLPLDERVLAEVRQYNQRYGIATWADITLEWNSRCKDVAFQGKEFRYAYTDIPLIKDSLERLVTQGKLKRVVVKGAEPSYAIQEATK